MRASLALAILLSLLLAGLPGGAEERPEQPAPEPTGAPAAMAPQIQAAYDFLVAWGRGRLGEVRSVAADTVVVRSGEDEYLVDVASGTADPMLVFPFRGLSTVRVEGRVKGVTVEQLTIKAGGVEIQGRGTLTLEERDGEFIVTGVSVE
ncbi:MAG: hypothetical protein ACE5JD_05240 [Candidatus Methylomirabilia bacterium]